MDFDHADPDRAGTLHHVGLCTSNLERSVDFWGWLLGELGYEAKDEWHDGRSWRKEATYIVIKQANNNEPSYDREAPGLNHLAFHASSRDRVDELTEGIRERDDSTLLFEEQHPYAGGYHALYCENPDEVKVEIVGPE